MNTQPRLSEVGRRVVLVASLVAASLGVVACANPMPIKASLCSEASADTLRSLQRRIMVAGDLRNGYQFQAAGSRVAFVSAELHKRADNVTKPGDILTWATAPTGPQTAFASVDENARHKSSWPRAEVDVRTDGAVQSRGCTYENRGYHKPDTFDYSNCPASISRSACKQLRQRQ